MNDILLKLDESFVVSHEKNEENDKRNKWKVTVDQEQVCIPAICNVLYSVHSAFISVTCNLHCTYMHVHYNKVHVFVS